MISKWHETEWRGDEQIKGILVMGDALGRPATPGLPATPGGMTATEVASAPSDDAVVEAMARAMCEAVNPRVGPHYPTPDDPSLIYAPDSVRGVRTGKAWEHFASAARAQLKAHEAMEAVRSGKVVPL